MSAQSKISKMTLETLTHELKIESVDINDLILNFKVQRDAFFAAIKARPILLSKIKGANALHLLVPAIEQNPANFIYLTKDQYTEELAQIYISYRLNESSAKNISMDETNFGLTAQNSMDNKVLLNYSYVTRDDEELYYFDNELQVPSSIKSYFKATLKIVNALDLINKFDLHITQLGENKIKTTLTDIFDNQYKAFLSNYIAKKKIGYYTLCTTLSDFEEEFAAKITKVFKPYGIELTEFIIRKLAIPKDIQYRLEDQAFQIRQLKADNEASNEFAKNSLKNYETKLAIEEKYPNAEHTLTEYEKDLALKRYLIKHGRNDECVIDHGISIKKSKDKYDDAVNKKKDVVPDIPKKTNPARTTYFTFLTIAAIINLVLLFIIPGPALIILGVLTAGFGLIGGFCYDKLKPYKTEFESSNPQSTTQSSIAPTAVETVTQTNNVSEE